MFRRNMLRLALDKMEDFSLQGSQYGDNRSILKLIATLVESAPGESLSDCRAPLAAVLQMPDRNGKMKFQGCKLGLLQKAIATLFGGSKKEVFGAEFSGYDREKLLAYLEFCRRIFVSEYTPTVIKPATEPEPENAMQRALRLALEKR